MSALTDLIQEILDEAGVPYDCYELTEYGVKECSDTLYAVADVVRGGTYAVYDVVRIRGDVVHISAVPIGLDEGEPLDMIQDVPEYEWEKVS